MKIAVNTTFGGFGFSDPAIDELGFSWDIDRTDPKLINLIETKGSTWISDRLSSVGIATIPDNITDWRIHEYDGKETVLYVVDGKIREAVGERVD